MDSECSDREIEILKDKDGSGGGDVEDKVVVDAVI